MRRKKHASKTFAALAAVLLLAALGGCGSGGAEAVPTEPASGTETVSPTEDIKTAEPSEPAESAEFAEPSDPAAVTERQDGERFEAVIILEGMEETVQYEHIRNDTIGFEMDYDYELFVRSSESDRECFVSVWDDPDNPENYLEVTYRAEDADTVAASVSEELSNEYELLTESLVLDRAGDCIRIDASEVKGGGIMPDLLQAVYIIPAADGCIVATEHYAIESAEGFGRRFSYMINTLSPIELP